MKRSRRDAGYEEAPSCKRVAGARSVGGLQGEEVVLFQGGIKNLGNTCYLSAILQALLCLRAFISDLKAFNGLLTRCLESSTAADKSLLSEIVATAS